MLTWAIVTLVLRGMRAARESKTKFSGDVGCLLMLTIPADIVIVALIVFAIMRFAA